MRAAADALVGQPASTCPACRRARLEHAVAVIARARARNRQAAAGHRRATLARLEGLGIDVGNLRCCILE